MSIEVCMERSIQDWVWRKKNEELHPNCIDYKKWATSSEMMFWRALR